MIFNWFIVRLIYDDSMQTIVITYLIIINLLTLVMFGRDKRRATRSWWRISERQLYILMWFGWLIGALLGMKIFRHKTIKPSFIMRFATIAFVWIMILLIILFQ